MSPTLATLIMTVTVVAETMNYTPGYPKDKPLNSSHEKERYKQIEVNCRVKCIISVI